MDTYQANWGLIGHHWVVDLLSAQLVGDRASHAYLFTGLPQTGKTTLATRLAQAMNCADAHPPCGRCRTCDLIARGIHPDVQTVAPEGRSIKIEAIRDLQRDLTLNPFEARCRVAIILDVQLATDHAADALLKTLEEPPPSSRLLLTADAADRVLPTIVSRCQVIALRPVPTGEIAAALAADFDTPPHEADLLARLAVGRPGWAVAAIQDPSLLEMRSTALDQMLAVLRADRVGRFAYCEELARDSALSFVLGLWQSWWRDVLLAVERSPVEPVNIDRVADIEQATALVLPEQARRALRAVRTTLDALDRNANTRLALEVMLLEMPYL